MKTPKPAPRTSKNGSGKTKKAAAKPAAKPAKPAAKSATKSSLKKSVGSAVKKTVKSVKSVASKISKAVARVKKKVTAKRAEKSAAAKTPPKKSPAKTAVKAATKTSTKPAAKTAAKPATKTAVKKIAEKTAAKPAAKAAASKRPKAFAPRDVARAFGFPAEAPEIPEFYGEDRLVLMTKDPEYLFAYWEITPERQDAGRKAMLPGEEYREAMRLNWAARDLFDANYVLMPVTHAARKWYMRVPFSGIGYHVELGWLSSQGHFISLLTSNASDSPESWTATRRRLKDAAAGTVLSRTLQAGRPQGSSENVPVHAEKLAAPVAGDWNFGGPGTTGSSFGKSAKKKRAG